MPPALATFKQQAAPTEEIYSPAPSLASAFGSICARFGHRIALSMGDEEMTYTELSRASRQVASALESRTHANGSIVAIYMPRSIDMVVATLGVVRAACTYLPLDPGYPVARVMETIADARPSVILTTRALAANLRNVSVAMVFMDELDRYDTTAPLIRQPRTDAPAYIIYTSGSTGQPKGVLVSHHNVLRLLSQTRGWFDFSEDDVWTLFHSLAFDFSVWEMWGCLLTGGRLVIVPFDVSRSPEDFLTLLQKQRVTVLNQTPSAFLLISQLKPRRAAQPLALRYVIFGGEALNLRSLAPWVARFGDDSPKLINMYGITETTVHVTYRRILAADVSVETESLIGEPIPDLTLYLLDRNLLPVADGEPGELCIGGAGVSLGYLRRPELNEQRFIPDPFGGNEGRLYRSGDLARRRPDGELVYIGRADRQVKINGFRIELGEVEATLAHCPGVTQACVKVHSGDDGKNVLVAYFLGNKVDARTVSLFMAGSLPVHMRPAHYIALASMPLNINGKVDTNALPAPPSAPPSTRPVADTLEGRIAAIWARVLQTDSFELDDNFFDIGGSSVRLMAVRSALQTEMKSTVSITTLFEFTTVRTLAAKLQAKPHEARSANVAHLHDRAQQQRDAFHRMRQQRSVGQ